jgi:hypothetical protein
MLSKKQSLIRDFLLNKIGFTPGDFLSKYATALEKTAPKLRFLEAIPKPPAEAYKIGTHYNKIFYRISSENTFRDYEEKYNLFVPRTYNIIDFLNYELKIKGDAHYRERNKEIDLISATDISNYTYCPANFSISKTFDLLKIESAYIGTDMHEENRLSGYLEANNKRRGLYSFSNPANAAFFEELKQSDVVYLGHQSSSKKYFTSAKGNYAGQPDYIFKNTSGQHFVVEEKFQYQSWEDKIEQEKMANKAKSTQAYDRLSRSNTSMNNNFTSNAFKLSGASCTSSAANRISSEANNTVFYPNHINQVTSYLYGISDFNIEYAYLVYWKYFFDYGIPRTHSCYVMKIEKSPAALKRLTTAYAALKAFIDNKTQPFDIAARSPAKCASCVSSLLCGHKTGRFNEVKFPYSKEYLQTYQAEFPAELKRGHVPKEIRNKFKGKNQ